MKENPENKITKILGSIGELQKDREKFFEAHVEQMKRIREWRENTFRLEGIINYIDSKLEKEKKNGE